MPLDPTLHITVFDRLEGSKGRRKGGDEPGKRFQNETVRISLCSERPWKVVALSISGPTWADGQERTVVLAQGGPMSVVHATYLGYMFRAAGMGCCSGLASAAI